ncbi:MAG TPA: hypothetical protein VFD92_20520 [Candidatus Binatia bacterium]|nr:hypothetical protein [Candidatus Binatia bacterium]
MVAPRARVAIGACSLAPAAQVPIATRLAIATFGALATLGGLVPVTAAGAMGAVALVPAVSPLADVRDSTPVVAPAAGVAVLRPLPATRPDPARPARGRLLGERSLQTPAVVALEAEPFRDVAQRQRPPARALQHGGDSVGIEIVASSAGHVPGISGRRTCVNRQRCAGQREATIALLRRATAPSHGASVDTVAAPRRFTARCT